jgi:hypothetical protein
VFNTKVLRKNLETFKAPAGVIKNPLAFQLALDMLTEGLFESCGNWTEMSTSETLHGSNDGLLAGLPMTTAIGFGFKDLGKTKLEGMAKAGDLLLHIHEEDYKRVCSSDETPVYAWATKMSLKDARLPIEKLADDKGRVFQGEAMPAAMTGRRLIGNFIGKFMAACAAGGFPGIVSFVLSRGGWHDMLKDLTDDFFIKTCLSADVKKWDKNWLHEFHYWIVSVLARICGSKELARRIWRHYERVAWGPTVITIYGILIYMTKGMPSGDIATVIFNTLGQVLMYMYVYACIVPVEFCNFTDFNANLRLKALGDDSAAALSSAMYGWLSGRSFSEEVRKGFAEPGWEIELIETDIQGIEFVGHRTILAKTSIGEMHLPVLPERTVMAINEWMKKKNVKGQPIAVRYISRYYAGFERAFPYLWSDNEMMIDYCRLAYNWLQRVQRKYWNDPDTITQKAARSVPGLREIADLYFPWRIDLGEVLTKLGDSWKKEALSVGPGAGIVPCYGNYCGPGHPKTSDYTKDPVDAFDAVCQQHDQCYDKGIDRAVCDGAMANDLSDIEEVPTSLYGQLYLAAADKYMDAVGASHKLSLHDVLNTVNRELVDLPHAERVRLLPQLVKQTGIPRKAQQAVVGLVKATTFFSHNKKKGKRGGRKGPLMAPGAGHEKGAFYSSSAKGTARSNKGKRKRAKIQRRARRGQINRKFTKLMTKGGQAMAGLAPYAKKVEGAWHIKKGKHEDSIVLTGSDLLDILATDPTSQAPVGAEVYILPLSPTDTAWVNTRLQQFAPLFQRFKFRKLSVKYEPIANATISGQLLHYIDYDTDSDYTPVDNTKAALQFAAAHKKNQPFQVFEESRARYTPDGEIQTLFLAPGKSGSDPRLYSQGRYHIFNVSAPPFTMGSSTPLGVLYAEYEIELWDSALGTTSIGDAPDVPGGNSIWEYVFPGLADDGTDIASSTDSFGIWVLNGAEGAGPMTPTGGDMDELSVSYSNTEHLLTIVGWPYTQIRVDFGLTFRQDNETTRAVAGTFQDPVGGSTNVTPNSFWTSTFDHIVQKQSGITSTAPALNMIVWRMVYDVVAPGVPITLNIDTLGGDFNMSAGPDPYHYDTQFVLRRNGAFHNTDPGVLSKKPCFWK